MNSEKIDQDQPRNQARVGTAWLDLKPPRELTAVDVWKIVIIHACHRELRRLTDLYGWPEHLMVFPFMQQPICPRCGADHAHERHSLERILVAQAFYSRSCLRVRKICEGVKALPWIAGDREQLIEDVQGGLRTFGWAVRPDGLFSRALILEPRENTTAAPPAA